MPIHEFLKSNKTTTKATATHYGLGNEMGKYEIHDLEELYNLLQDNYAKGGNTISLTEVQEDISKIVIDLDFKTKERPEGNTIYDVDGLKEFCEIYADVISYEFKIKRDDDRLNCYIDVKKDVIEENGFYKNGLHIHFPYVACHHSIKSIMRKKVIDVVNEKCIFEPYNLSNKVEDVIDNAIIKSNGWFPYNCGKPNDRVYQTKYIYTCDDVFKEYDEDHNLGLFYSQRINNNDNMIIDKRTIKEVIEKQANIKSLTPVKANAVKIQKLLNILEPSRCEDYYEWLTIAMALKSSGLDEARDLFIEYSQQSKKFTESKDMKTYDDLDINVNNGITLGTIYYYAKEDNPTEFKKITSYEFNIELFAEQIEYGFTQNDMARIFIKFYKDDFIITDSTLYSWDGFIWEQEDKEQSLLKHTIQNKFSNRCGYVFKNIIDYFKDEFEKTGLPHYKELIKMYKQHLTHLKSVLNNESSLKGVANSVNRSIINDDIIFNDHPYIFCFKNKYIDLRKEPDNNEIEGKKDLFISQSCGYEYDPNIINKDDFEKFYKGDDVEGNEAQQELFNILKQILPNVEQRNMALKISATSMMGQTLEKFTLYTGGGRNGKGVLNELLQATLGNYAYNGNSELLLSSIPKGGCPELANMDNKRFICFTEPDENRKICFSTIKTLTGGAKLSARALFSNKTDVRICATIILECNEKPLLDCKANKAVSERLIEVPFTSTFTNKEAFPDREDVFQASAYFKTNEFRNKVKSSLFSLLTYYFYKYHHKDAEQVVIPQSIQDITQEYIESANDMNEYFKELDITITNDTTDTITIKKMFADYKASELYYNTDKKDKKKQIEKWFRGEVMRNPRLGNYYKERIQCNKKNIRNCLVGVIINNNEFGESE